MKINYGQDTMFKKISGNANMSNFSMILILHLKELKNKFHTSYSRILLKGYNNKVMVGVIEGGALG